MITIYLEAVEQAHGGLTATDQATGDGDFGDNLRGGLRAAAARTPAQASMAEEFRIASGCFLDDVGGTSGPLLCLLFQAVAAGLEAGGDVDRALVSGLTDGLAAIQRVGKARVGDRTLVDCLAPTLEGIVVTGGVGDKEGVAGGVDWAAAARSALENARATAAIPARMGRSSYLGLRAVGTPDPGAMGVALLFWALAVVRAPGSRDQLPAPADAVSATSPRKVRPR